MLPESEGTELLKDLFLDLFYTVEWAGVSVGGLAASPMTGKQCGAGSGSGPAGQTAGSGLSKVRTDYNVTTCRPGTARCRC